MDGQGFITWLQTNNVFLIPLDTEDRWFRYHHLFQDLLRGELKRQCSNEEIAALHHGVSKWFDEKSLTDEAIHHAVAAGDFVGAVQIVERDRYAALNNDQWITVERWLARIPDQIKQPTGS